jgi:hypothetical protein
MRRGRRLGPLYRKDGVWRPDPRKLSWLGRMPNKTRRLAKRAEKQRGGAELYHAVGDLTKEKILDIFCNGRPFDSFPSADRPIFLLKWGPPGSGKSSAKVRSFIDTLGVDASDFIDYSPDKIIENLVPYRFESALAKAEYERMKADYERKDYAAVKQRLSSYVLNLKGRYTSSVKKNVNAFVKSWPSGRPVPISKMEEFEKILNDVLYDKSASIYSFYRLKNKTGSTKTIREKMRDVLAELFTRDKFIQYESGGAGYGEGMERKRLVDQFTPHRLSRTVTRGSVKSSFIEIFKNTQEELLGKIEYDSTNMPIGIDQTSIGPITVPMNYRIVVVYPVIPREKIAERAQKRAAHMFFQKNDVAINDIDTYRFFMMEYAAELFAMLGGENPVHEIVDQALRIEQEKHGENSSIPYTEYIKGLITKLRNLEDGELISIPFFRGIGPTAIMDSVEQAFQYSVDYFLKQYLLIGRIEQVVYINTA